MSLDTAELQGGHTAHLGFRTYLIIASAQAPDACGGTSPISPTFAPLEDHQQLSRSKIYFHGDNLSVIWELLTWLTYIGTVEQRRVQRVRHTSLGSCL